MAKKVKLNQELTEEKKQEQKTPVVSDAKEKSSKKVGKKKDKNQKEAKIKKVGKAVRETTSELKKVTWPTFKEVV